MVVGEFTVSSISADQDRKDEELEAAIKKAEDHTKLKADIVRLKELAKSVWLFPLSASFGPKVAGMLSHGPTPFVQVMVLG